MRDAPALLAALRRRAEAGTVAIERLLGARRSPAPAPGDARRRSRR